LSTLEVINGTSCVIDEPPPRNTHWQKVGIRLKKLHLECEIIPLSDFTKILGLPNIPIPGLGSTSSTPATIVLDGTDIDFIFEFKINFEDETINITKLEISEGSRDNSFQLELKGNSLFTQLGELITKPKPVRTALEYVTKFALRKVVEYVLSRTPERLLSILNCADY